MKTYTCPNPACGKSNIILRPDNKFVCIDCFSVYDSTEEEKLSPKEKEDHKHSDVFISYAHADNGNNWIKNFVKELELAYEKICGRDLKVFFDEDSIKNGEDWQGRIADNVASSKQFLAFISPNYFKSEWCRREWQKWIDTEISNSLLNEGMSPIQIIPVEGLFDELNLKPLEIADKLVQQVDISYPKQLKKAISKHIHEMNLRHHDNKKYKLHDVYANTLNELHKSALTETLEDLSQQLETRAQLIKESEESISTITKYNPKFTGRIEELIKLYYDLCDKSTTALTCIYGMGGMGKSELAYTYAHAYAHAYPGGRYYIACENKESLKDAVISQALSSIGNATGIFAGINEDEYKDPELCFKAVCRNIAIRLKAKGSILLVLDNVTDPHLLDDNQTVELRNTGDNLHLLATSRKAPKEKINTLSLKELNLNDSLELLRKFRYFDDGTEDAEAAYQICKELNGFTLAVELTGAYLVEHPEESYKYRLNHINLKGIDSIAEDEDVELHLHNDERKLSSIMQPLFESLTEESKFICYFAAVLPPDLIPLPWLKEIFLSGYKEYMEKEDGLDYWMKFLYPLQKLSVFSSESKNLLQEKTVRMHRLLQEWIISVMVLDIDDAFDIIMKSVDYKVSYHKNKDDLSENLWEINVINEVFKLFLTKKIENLEFLQNGENFAHLLSKMGNYKDAESLMHLIIPLIRNKLKNSTDDYELIFLLYTSLGRLASILSESGNSQKALEVAKERHAHVKSIINKFPNYDEEIKEIHAESYQEIGKKYLELGETIEAIEFLYKSKEMYINLSDNHPDDISHKYSLFDTNNQLSLAFTNIGDLSKALELLNENKQFIALHEDEQGNKVSFLHSAFELYEQIGSIYRTNGNSENALENYSKASVYIEQLLKIDKYNTKYIHHYLAFLCLDIAMSYQSISNLELSLEKYTEAISYLKPYYDNGTLGIIGLANLIASYLGKADILNINGDYDSALILSLETNEICKEIYNEQADNIMFLNNFLKSYITIGDAYFFKKDIENAHRYFLEGYELANIIFDQNINFEIISNNIAAIETKLGVIYEHHGEIDKAIDIKIKSCDQLQRLVKKNPENEMLKTNLQAAYYSLGDFYKDKEEYGQALSYYEKSLLLYYEIIKINPEQKNTKTTAFLSSHYAGTIYFDQGDFKHALKHHLNVENLFNEVFRLNIDEVLYSLLLLSYLSIIEIYKNYGDIDNILNYSNKAIDLGIDACCLFPDNNNFPDVPIEIINELPEFTNDNSQLKEFNLNEFVLSVLKKVDDLIISKPNIVSLKYIKVTISRYLFQFYKENEEFDQAFKELETVHAISEKYKNEYSDLQLIYINSFDEIGDLYYLIDDIPRAIENYTKYNTLLKEYISVQPDDGNEGLLWNLALSSGTFGILLYKENNDNERGLGFLTESLEIFKHLEDIDYESDSLLNYIAEVYKNIALILKNKNRIEEALLNIESANNYRMKILDNNDDTTEVYSELGEDFKLIGELHFLLGKKQEASKYIADAIDIFKSLLEISDEDDVKEKLNEAEKLLEENL